MELNLCLLGDRDSYYKDFDTNNSQKGEKSKSGDFHSDGQSALLKNNTENNNNDPVVGQKRPITNNDGDNNTPANFPCFQNPAQTVYDVEEDLETINQIDQEQTVHINQRTFGNIKKLHEQLLILQNCGEIYTPQLIITCHNG